MELKYLVVGTGRCGSVYMAGFLSYLGISCGHESIFTTEGISEAIQRITGKSQIKTSQCSINAINSDWFNPQTQIAESSYMAVPYLNHSILKQTQIIHLIRNPLLVLSSWILDVKIFSRLAPYRNFILQHAPRMREEKTEIEKIARYIIDWNKMIERGSPKIVIKIEDYPYEQLLNFLGKSSNCLPKNSKINSWGKRTRNLTFEDIPNGNTKNEFIELYSQNYKINKL